LAEVTDHLARIADTPDLDPALRAQAEALRSVEAELQGLLRGDTGASCNIAQLFSQAAQLTASGSAVIAALGNTLRQHGHLKPGSVRRGTGAGLRAANGLINPSGRRVIVKARYAVIKAGDLGTARAHLHCILRDGVTREGEAGQLYTAGDDHADADAFLQRSENDPHQFRFIIAPEDSDRIADLKPFIRDLVAQMEHDLDARLDWVAVDHFNTGHPHTHLVIRGRDQNGRELVMARDYIA
jgi:hypothetical protein